jgi:hypothetical protein
MEEAMPNRSGSAIRFGSTRLAFGLCLLFAAAHASGQAPLCATDSHTLCLNGNRFAVTAVYQLTPSGPSFQATAVPLTGETGYFWFFDESNVELIVKVLNGCDTAQHSYWVFVAGLTDVGVDLVVEDLRTREMQHYTSDLGKPFAPIQDTSAFACP